MIGTWWENHCGVNWLIVKIWLFGHVEQCKILWTILWWNMALLPDKFWKLNMAYDRWIWRMIVVHMPIWGGMYRFRQPYGERVYIWIKLGTSNGCLIAPEGSRRREVGFSLAGWEFLETDSGQLEVLPEKTSEKRLWSGVWGLICLSTSSFCNLCNAFKPYPPSAACLGDQDIHGKDISPTASWTPTILTYNKVSCIFFRMAG